MGSLSATLGASSRRATIEKPRKKESKMKEIKLIVPEIMGALTSQAATPDQSSQRHRQLVESHPWSYQSYHPELMQVLPAVKAFCLAALEGEEPRWLTLLGSSGIGKTHILTQAFRFLRKHWTMERRTQWPDGTWTGKMRQHAHIKPSRDLDDYRASEEYAAFDLIYVEDIGAGQSMGEKGAGAVNQSRLADLLQLRSRKWTLMCANLSRADVERKLDARIASRLNRDLSACLEISDQVPDFSDR